MMEIFRRIGKTDSKKKLTFFISFLLISFCVQTSLPRFVTVHHSHEGGTKKHQHAELQLKSPIKYQHDETDHPRDVHQRSDAHTPTQVDSKTGKGSLLWASGHTGHDHHNSFFLGEFVSETPFQEIIFSFRWNNTGDDQNQASAHRLGIHIRGPPLHLT